MTLVKKEGRKPKRFQRRILLVAPQPFYEDRGTPIAAKYVVTALSESGWDVDILTFPVGRDFDLPGVRVYRVGSWLRFKSIPIGLSVKKLLLDIFLSAAIWSRARRDEYACIHAIEESVYPALLAGRINHIPVIYDLQSSLVDELATRPLLKLALPRRLLAWCERKACESSKVVVCSLGLGQRIIEKNISAQVHEWVFPRQSDSAPGMGPNTIRKELGLPQSAKVIIYTGNFECYQGLPLLIAAIPQVVRSYPDIVFLLAGADESSMRVMSKEHADLIEQGNLVLLTRQPRLRIIELLEIAELAVSPRSRGANMPLKVFDYLAAGLPVVATDIDAHRLLPDQGLILASPTPEDFAKALAGLLENPLLIRKYSKAAHCFAEKELSWPTFRERVSRIYDEVALASLAAAENDS